tara:strand:+ start:112 stop:747 length:636 start_codon:yes stop_codon:yes gene_type:complete
MAQIYKLTNSVTNKSYIGYTGNTVESRFKVHCGLASSGSKTYLHRSMVKHGYHVWNLSVLESSEDDQYLLNERESYYINQYKSMSLPLYNMTDGGDGGDTSKSPNYIEGMKNRRDYSGENNPMYGVSRKGEKHKGGENISSGTKAAWASDAGIIRKAAQSINFSGKSNPMYGKTPTNAISIVFGGVSYESLAKCSRDTGRSVPFIKKNLDT